MTPPRHQRNRGRQAGPQPLSPTTGVTLQDWGHRHRRRMPPVNWLTVFLGVNAALIMLVELAR